MNKFSEILEFSNSVYSQIKLLEQNNYLTEKKIKFWILIGKCNLKIKNFI
jgi:hypothetical protein